jgi:hypothetical protein
MLWPRAAFRWAGLRRALSSFEVAVIRLISAWLILEGLALWGVPITKWVPFLRPILGLGGAFTGV